MQQYEQDWNAVWISNKQILHKLINLGRTIYNHYFLNAILKYTDEDTSFVELGCGTSTLIKKLAPYVQKIIGIDISDTALDLSKTNCKYLRNVTFTKDDCIKLKMASNQFDLVWSQGLIEHFDNPEVLIKEHIRICKPGKTILISVPYKYSYMTLWYLLTRPKITRFLWPWTNQIMFTPDLFFKLIKRIDYPAGNCVVYKKNPFLGIIIFRIIKK